MTVSISYKFINDELVLVEDNMDAWFGSIFQNYHTPESKQFIKYITKLNEYQNNNELIENDFYYGVKIINYTILRIVFSWDIISIGSGGM